jgi:uncharacterized protein YbcV (DUF1398 family)
LLSLLAVRPAHAEEDFFKTPKCMRDFSKELFNFDWFITRVKDAKVVSDATFRLLLNNQIDLFQVNKLSKSGFAGLIRLGISDEEILILDAFAHDATMEITFQDCAEDVAKEMADFL